MNSPWLERTGLLWLQATESENDFAECLATQARLGYCWCHLAQLFPQRGEFKKAAEKSFRQLQYSFAESEVAGRIYDHSFYLLFMAWYFRLTSDPTAIRLLINRYAEIERHFDNAGPGGFSPKPAGLRSHNPYMHLLEATLAAFRSTEDDYWLAQSRRIGEFFTARLLDTTRNVVPEFRNPDWSVAAEGRVEIGHQLEWSSLLLELDPAYLPVANQLYNFALKHGFEDGLTIDAVNGEGVPIDRRKLLWSQTEAARHFAIRGEKARAAEQWELIHHHFFHPNGWTWYNSLTAGNTPITEPAFARLLYHVVTAAAELT
jgi:mannose-6-phosphate isomerase